MLNALFVTSKGSPFEIERIARTLSRSAHLTTMRADRTVRGGLKGVSRPDFVVVAEVGHASLTIKAIARAFPKAPLIVTRKKISTDVSDREYKAGATAVVPFSSLADALKRIVHVSVSADLDQTVTPRLSAAPSGNVVEELHDTDTGRLNAREVASILGTSLSAVAKATGLTPSALSKRPDAKAAQPALRELEFSIVALRRVLATDSHVRAWLNAPHPDLSGEAPINLLTKGSAKDLADYVRGALSGQPT